jgi:surface antigen
LLALAGCGGGPLRGASGSPSAVECAPFARQVSGVQLYGDAASWWDQADGRYDRSHEPREGGVLVFRRSARLPSGHVSVVAEQVSNREIRVTQANWVHHMITRDEPVLDVSPGNDWSRVRVWWAPANALGSTVYSTYGFIAAARPRPHSDLVAGRVQP